MKTPPNSRYDDRAKQSHDGAPDVTEDTERASNGFGDRSVAPGGVVDWSHVIIATPTRLGGPKMAPGMNAGPSGRMTLAEWKEEQKQARAKARLSGEIKDDVGRAQKEAREAESLDDVAPVDATPEQSHDLADLTPEDIF